MMNIETLRIPKDKSRCFSFRLEFQGTFLKHTTGKEVGQHRITGQEFCTRTSDLQLSLIAVHNAIQYQLCRVSA